MIPNVVELGNKFASNVAVVSSSGPYGDNVMTCAWVNRASFNPGMVSIAIGKDRASFENIRKSKEFGINICSTEQNVLASVAGSCSARDTDKIKVLKEMGFKFYKATKIKCLMIEDCSLMLECKLIGEVKAGDHSVFIGEIIEGKSTEKEPILYSKGKYWAVGTQVQKPGADVLEKINKLVEKNKK